MPPVEGDLADKVERLKVILVDQATGGAADDEEYQELRSKLRGAPRVGKALPRFIHSCRNIREFWNLIKGAFSTYGERREFLRDEFGPVQTVLEDGGPSPSDEPISETLETVDSEYVAAAWRKALERREADPEGAITAARTLLESVCKCILDEAGGDYDDKANLPTLYRAVAEVLELAPDHRVEKVFKQVLGGCQTVVEGLGAMRNRLGDAHGKGKKGVRPAPRHAELAVNLAGSMASFLIATWEAREG